MRKLISIFIICLLFHSTYCVARECSRVNIEKSNEYTTGVYKFNNDIKIEYTLLKDIDEAIVYIYTEYDKEMENKNNKINETLESALYTFCRQNMKYINTDKKYFSYKVLKMNIHYNVLLKDDKNYVILEVRILFKE